MFCERSYVLIYPCALRQYGWTVAKQLLCHLRSLAAHRDHFVRRLSVCLSICLSVCPVVSLSWKSRIAMFHRRHMHSLECCHYVIYGHFLNDKTTTKFGHWQYLLMSGSHTFLVVRHSYVSQATHAFIGMLPLCYLWTFP